MAKTQTFFTPNDAISTSVSTDGLFTTPDGATALLVSGYCSLQVSGSPTAVVVTKVGTSVVEIGPEVALAANTAFSLKLVPAKEGAPFGESVGLRIKPGGASSLGEIFAQGVFTP